MTKMAKILCTIGPSSARTKTLLSMMANGMDVARLNFSHGSHDDHAKVIQLLRECSQRAGKPVAILQDLQGIKIRIGRVANGEVTLAKGKNILLRKGSGLSDAETIYINYPRLYHDLLPGHKIMIDDGLIQLKIKKIEANGIQAQVLEGGKLHDRKGVNLPDTRIQVKSFTAKDKKDLDFGIKMKVDFVAISFVRNSADIKKIKNYLRLKGYLIPVIAKIEKPEALDNIDAIITEADGIMIARGDLGVEMSPEKVPVIQKKLIRLANDSAKIVITATQMLESMTHHSKPTRAEANDVANAIIDGSDALMLSAETSIGDYPVESVKIMKKIIEYTENNLPETIKHHLSWQKTDMPYAACDAAVRASADVHAKAIVAFTNSGYTSQLISKFRPRVPIYSFTMKEEVQKLLTILWGVRPFIMKPLANADEMVSQVETHLKAKKLARKGDIIVIVASLPFNIHGKTNFMKLHKMS